MKETIRKDIAIIGMACRFPDASNYRQFWHNLATGRNSIAEITPDRWDLHAYYSPDITEPNKSISKWCGLIKDIDKFDNQFFNISPKESKNMDPQQRMLLEEAWHCIEDSGISLTTLQEKKTSVYAGAMGVDYHQALIDNRGETGPHACLGNYDCIIANRVSYTFGLSGQSMTIAAACASSLIALHEARRALQGGSCDYALVAGVNLNCHPWKYISFSKSRMLSPDGQCKTFDQAANGYVPGEGIGVLLLQRLSDATADKNNIYGVVIGSGVNHGGRAQSITAPRVAAQKQVILAAYEDAGVNPDTVSYVEAHGTGTSLGDPIEIEALDQAFKRFTSRTGFCKIGSVKTNIGHLEAAAGIAGVIKVLLMMRHKKIPQSLHVHTINPVIDLDATAFQVARQSGDWDTDAHPLRAGVSSFGFGGSNSHVLIESSAAHDASGGRPAAARKAGRRPGYPFILSARSSKSLSRAVEQWKDLDLINNLKKYSLRDICATLMTGRGQYSHRFGCFLHSIDQLPSCLAPPTVMAATRHPWSLVIGETALNPTRPMEEQINRDPFFRQGYEKAMEESALPARLKKRLKRAGHDKPHPGLHAFFWGYSCCRGIMGLGFAPEIICGMNTGLWIALALCGMAGIGEIVAVITGEKKMASLPLRRPERAFYDPVHRRPVMPYHFDPAYVEKVVGGIRLAGEEIDYYTARASMLLNHQYTFKKYIDQWNIILRRRQGKSLEQLMKAYDPRNNTKEKRDVNILITLIIASSLKRLNRKWDLDKAEKIEDPRFRELMSWVVDGALPKQEAVDMIVGPTPGFDTAAELLNKNQAAVRHTGPSTPLHEIKDPESWIKKALTAPVEAPANMRRLSAGSRPDGPASPDSVHLDVFDDEQPSLAETLLQLWLNGVDIRWGRLMPAGTFHKMPLPGYCFDKQTFWLPQQQEKPRSQIQTRTFHIHEPIIRDHVITDRHLIPGACIILLALKALKSAFGYRINQLQNVYLVNPGIVDTDTTLRAEVDPSRNRFIVRSDSQIVCRGEYDGSDSGDAVETADGSCEAGVMEDADAVYRALGEHGYAYGKSLKIINRIRQCRNGYVFDMAAAQGAFDTLFPVILDGLLQTALCFAHLAGRMPPPHELYIPYFIKRLVIQNTITNRCAVPIGRGDVRMPGDDMSARLRAFNAAGQCILALTDMVFKKVPGDFLRPHLKRPPVSNLNDYVSDAVGLYTPGWSPRALTAEKRGESKTGAVFLKQNHAREAAFVRELSAHYQTGYFIQPTPNGEQSPNTFHVDPLLESDYLRVLAEIKKTEGSYDLYFLWACGFDGHQPADEGDLPRIQQNGLQALFHLIRAIIISGLDDRVEIALITSAMHPVLETDDCAGYAYAGLMGLSKCAMRERSRLKIRLIDFGPGDLEPRNIVGSAASAYREIQSYSADPAVAYRNQKRYAPVFLPVPPPPDETIPAFRDRGVYLLAGGAGKIGLQVAGWISGQCDAAVALIGRSRLNAKKQRAIRHHLPDGKNIHYFQADVGDAEEMRACIQTIAERHGPIRGVIQMAGVLADRLLTDQNWESCQRVLAPKITGTWWLNQLTRNLPLDFFMVFSSTVSIWGNSGQADYAAANSFLDAFSHYRARHPFPGKSICLNLTLVADGEMGAVPAVARGFSRRTGVVRFRRVVEQLHRVMTGAHRQYILIGEGKANMSFITENHLIGNRIGMPDPAEDQPASAHERENTPGEVSGVPALKDIEKQLTKITGKILDIDVAELDLNSNLREFGLDSVSISDIASAINDQLAVDMDAALLFEYTSLGEIAQYISEHYPARPSAENEEKTAPVEPDAPPRVAPEPVPEAPLKAAAPLVAVIGIGCKFPGADDPETFWENLMAARDLITEIPPSRWQWESSYGDPSGAENKTNSKWGGFLADISSFDPGFFNISPREAEVMDPQQRLLLEEVWHAIEDAGYPASRLHGSKTGVFIGVCNTDYNELMIRNDVRLDAYTAIGSYFSIIPNRISYILGLHGPSVAVDTACSSSLVAIHQAIGAIQNDECALAIAGGVNVCCTPRQYFSFSNAGMLSADGRCKTFDKGANGYVRGEGVGVVVLKPLAQAIADGDQIYGLIRSSAVNHGGSANSLTAPNPAAQAQLLVSAYERARIDPATVGYIEAHGTGTRLGDPIEINGLKKAFARLYRQHNRPMPKTAHCALGSVKTQIGHLEAAAGIAGVIKVLLAMKQGKLPGNLHFKELNPQIHLEDSPFYVIDKTETWHRFTDDAKRQLPRRAGVSAFGFGGANAHVVLEEYPAPDTAHRPRSEAPQLAVLSARSRDRLKDHARRLKRFLSHRLSVDKAGREKPDLMDVVYTLQTGREPMAERLAIVVSTMAQLIEKLTDFIEDDPGADGVFQGHVKRDRLMAEPLISGRAGREFVRAVIEERELTRIAQLWVSGMDIDWRLLHGEGRPGKISLPTYPFARETYWVPRSDGDTSLAMPASTDKLHPLIHRNESTLTRQRFTTRLSGQEFFLADHVIGGRRLLPAAAHIELARAAGEIAGEDAVCKIKNIVFSSPLSVTNGAESLGITLQPVSDGVAFEVTGNGGSGQPAVYSQGQIIYETDNPPSGEPARLDMDAIQKSGARIKTREDCYHLFKANGLEYGPGFQTIQTLHYTDTEAVSHLGAPAPDSGREAAFYLPPGVLDGALQTAFAWLGFTDRLSDGPHIPFAIEEVELFGPLRTPCHAHVRMAENRQHPDGDIRNVDIRLLDESGLPRVKINRLSLKKLSPALNTDTRAGRADGAERIYYRPVWHKRDAADNPATAPMGAGGSDTGAVPRCLVFGEAAGVARALADLSHKGSARLSPIVTVRPGKSFARTHDRQFTINPDREEDYAALFELLNTERILPDVVIQCCPQEADHDRRGGMNARLKKGIYRTFFLSRALMKQSPRKNIRWIVLYPGTPDQGTPFYEAIGGFARTLCLENPAICFTLIEMPDLAPDATAAARRTLALRLRHEMTADVSRIMEIRYADGHRREKAFEKIDTGHPAHPEMESVPSLIKENGVYLITGGAGGLGRIVAAHMARRVRAKFILSGRSNACPDGGEIIARLESMGSEAIYIPADVASHSDVRRLVARGRERFRKIDGVIHGAGIIRDALIANKQLADMKTVLAPKVAGTIHLDEASAGENLDFFVMFSSISAVTGNRGQGDYAYANSFMDSYASMREKMRKRGARSGKTLAINWPLWRDGGMRVDAKSEMMLKTLTGMSPLSTPEGVSAFDYALSSATGQFIVAKGHAGAIARSLNHTRRAADRTGQREAKAPATGHEGTLIAAVQQDLAAIVARILKITADDVDPDEDMRVYGFDSISLTDFANRINKKYDLELTPTLFFEHPSLGALGRHLCRAYKDAFHAFYETRTHPAEAHPAEAHPAEAHPAAARPATPVPTGQPAVSKTQGLRFFPTVRPDAPSRYEPIAIIGMDGRMPQSENLQDLWESLESGRDLITTVPADRWDWRAYWGDASVEANKTHAKWGGFLKEVNKFDPLFFGISPREAELMDPQHRLFLETVWKTIEDAGYRVSDMSGTRTGVFVGVSTFDYSDLLIDRRVDVEALSSTGTCHSILPNRISYLLNLTGPSQAIDTACSSSLVAVHKAVQAIHAGSCRTAIAGGVNIMLHPKFAIAFSKAGMLSADGRCRTFDKRANGYVRGEGVGAILLKPLQSAVSDKDHIHAVIRSTAENHNGRANSLTAPNPNAQAELLIAAYEQARMDPRTISYIEAHGTGTSLGDPIEINGIKKAFQTLYRKSGQTMPQQAHCGIGSVKTNIGHLEAAAGIAGIIKVLLAMKYEKLPGNIHLKHPNPHINLDDSPCYLIRHTIPWNRLRDADNRAVPRRAGVSSFGFGGANAHVVLEENPVSPERNLSDPAGVHLIVLSAGTQEALKSYARHLIAFIEHTRSRRTGHPLPIRDMAYTLQVGRDAMSHRLALPVTDLAQLVERLTTFVDGKSDGRHVLTGHVTGKKNRADMMIKGKAGREFLNILMADRELDQLARLWVSGVKIDWQLLHADGTARRISLPTYPFTGQRYWIPPSTATASTPGEAAAHPAGGHPLIDLNTSNFQRQQFVKCFSGDEFYLSDHVVSAQKVLPGVAYLEMALMAGELSAGKPVKALENIVWKKPFQLDCSPRQLAISLRPDANDAHFEIVDADTDEAPPVYAAGMVRYEDPTPAGEQSAPIDITAVKGRCEHRKKAACYRRFQEQGLQYGPAFQSLESLYHNSREALSRIELPECLRADSPKFFLHPAILDGALQTVSGLMDEDVKDPFLPFAIKRLVRLAPVTASCYAYATPRRGENHNRPDLKQFDIRLINEAGAPLVLIENLSLRKFKAGPSARTDPTHPVLLFQHTWRNREIPRIQPVEMDWGNVLLLDTGDAIHRRLNTRMRPRNGGHAGLVRVKPGDAFNARADHVYEVNPGRSADFVQLAAHLAEHDRMPEIIIHRWSANEFNQPNPTLMDRLDWGIYSVYHLMKALMTQRPSQSLRLLYLYQNMSDESADAFGPHHPSMLCRPLHASISGFLKSLALENPKLLPKVVETDNYRPEDQADPDALVDLIVDELADFTPAAVEIRHEQGRRWVNSSVEMGAAEESRDNILGRKSAVYLITGGLGGLGKVFAGHLAGRTKANLVLAGRSEPDEAALRDMQQLERMGSRVTYIRADVTRRGDVERLISEIKLEYNRLNGVIHAAGVIRDRLLMNKGREDIHAVIAPKILGTCYLDAATKNEPLDFFVLFSSISSVLGNAGQCDYAYGNRFMDYFSEQREALRLKNKRQGRTRSISWPIWQDGGMQIDRKTADRLMRKTGIGALETQAGLSAFERIIGMKSSHVVVLSGDPRKIRSHMAAPRHPSPSPDGGPDSTADAGVPGKDAISDQSILQRTEKYLITVFSRETKIPEGEIDEKEDFEMYGIDSVMGVQLLGKLEPVFGDLPKTLIFEYPSIDALALYFKDNHRDALLGAIGLDAPEPKQNTHAAKPETAAAHPIGNRFAASPADDAAAKSQTSGDIAIIGVGGKYPMVDSLERFWNHLKSGKTCITGIPKDRWDCEKHVHWNKDAQGAVQCRWGGFLPDVYHFDPLFFNISPKEAALMAPEERLFLETVYETTEDAGYPRESLSAYQQASSQGIGVFVGCMFQHYGLHASESTEKRIYINSYWSIANRISYFFNFTGPSVAIDTACSSSLTALHMACEHIRQNQCPMAIAGGVNLSLHPNKYIGLHEGMVLGSQMDSIAFSDGDGYIPGEGVGAVLLKPLSSAISDQDQIYGIIRASTISHSGKTKRFRALKEKAQTDLIVDTFKKARLNPRTISYMESAANGSATGDRVEISGLTKAFETLTPDKGFCAVGSVKSNIGNLEAASGISQLTKVLLQLKHKVLVPTVRTGALNRDLNPDGSPFYLQTELAPWRRPRLIEDGEERVYPRRAAISSFGVGGANAHVIVEEHVAERAASADGTGPAGSELFLYSAKSHRALKALVQKHIAFLKDQDHPDLKNMAYTLKVGREPMTARLAIVAGDETTLKDGLEQFLSRADREITSANIYYREIGGGPSSREAAAQPAAELLASLLSSHNMRELANLWTNGARIPWEAQYARARVRRISLPTYPFAKNRYFLAADAHPDSTATPPDPPSAPAQGDQPPGSQSAGPGGPGPEEYMEADLLAMVSGVMRVDKSEIDGDRPLVEYGLDSIAAMKIANRLNERYAVDLTESSIFQLPSLDEIIAYLLKNAKSSPVEPAVHHAGAAGEDDRDPITLEPPHDPAGRESKMAPPEKILTDVVEGGMALWVDGGRIRLRAPGGRVPDHIRNRLLANYVPLAAHIGKATYMPLSSSQKRYWILNLLQPGSPAYNNPIGIRLTGRLVEPALKSAVHELMNRHEILRAVFPRINQMPVQMIPPIPREIDWPMVDLSAVTDPVKREEEAMKIAESESRRPMDLAAGPTFRYQLVKLDPMTHRLLLTAHHTLVDGFSLELLIKELFDLYELYREGKSPAHQPVCRYVDYILAESADKPDGTHQEHWRKVLKGAPPYIDLPLDFKRPDQMTQNGNTARMEIPQETLSAFKDTLKEQNRSLFLGLLAALNISLFKWARQHDLVIGTIVQNRNSRKFEKTIGDFTNFLPVRVRLSDGQTVSALLTDLQKTVSNAMAHKHYPYEEIIKLAPKAPDNINPVYNVLANQLLPQSPLCVNENLTAVYSDNSGLSETAMIDLRFVWYEQPRGLTLQCEYNRDLFKGATITRLLETMHEIIERISESAEIKIIDIAGEISAAGAVEHKSPDPKAFAAADVPPVDTNAPAPVCSQPQPVNGDHDHEDQTDRAETILNTLRSIYARFLNVDEDDVDVDENFFEMGGSSFLAAQIMMAIEEEFFKIAITEVIQYPTIRLLADYLCQKSESTDKNVMTHGTGNSLSVRSVDNELFYLPRKDKAHANALTAS